MSDELPQGPLTQHLLAMHSIVTTLAAHSQLDTPDIVENHWAHIKAVAAYTRTDPFNHIELRPLAINEAIDKARLTGNGFIHIMRDKNGLLQWSSIEPDTVVFPRTGYNGSTQPRQGDD